MTPALLLLLALCLKQATVHCVILEAAPKYDVNGLADGGDGAKHAQPSQNNPNEKDLTPIVSNMPDQTDLEFKYPISAIGIDYDKNVVSVRFENQQSKTGFKYEPGAEERRRQLEHNFMRFGKRQPEDLPMANGIESDYYDQDPSDRFERSAVGGRDSRGDNFMRFGRSSQDFMRFGRNPADFMRFGRDSAEDFMRFGRNPKEDFMRFGRNPKQDFMRFGRNPKEDFMRFGRSPKEDFMRFGRNPKEDFMRFGRSPKEDFMRFGRNPKEDFMRFGRTPKQDFMRFGRTPKQDFMRFGRPDNFMRFGRTPPETGDKSVNFMRFGKSVGFDSTSETNRTAPASIQKNAIKEAAKLLKQAERDNGAADENNPMDQAIKVLFGKQQPTTNDMQTENENENDDASDEHYII